MMMPIFIEYNTNAGLLTSVTKKKKNIITYVSGIYRGKYKQGKTFAQKKEGKTEYCSSGKIVNKPSWGQKENNTDLEQPASHCKVGFCAALSSFKFLPKHKI